MGGNMMYQFNNRQVAEKKEQIAYEIIQTFNKDKTRLTDPLHALTISEILGRAQVRGDAFTVRWTYLALKEIARGTPPAGLVSKMLMDPIAIKQINQELFDWIKKDLPARTAIVHNIYKELVQQHPNSPVMLIKSIQLAMQQEMGKIAEAANKIIRDQAIQRLTQRMGQTIEIGVER